MEMWELLQSTIGYSGHMPKIGEAKEYTCPHCKKVHYDKRGFCSAECLRKNKERQKKWKEREQ